MTKLSPNFTLRELTRSEAAERQGIDNTPSPTQIENLKALCVNVLEPLRAHLGKPIAISSGYRGPEVNKLIGGSTTSQHSKGEAADFEVFGMSNHALARTILTLGIPFGQLILEFYSPTDPSAGWVHVSYSRGTNKGEVLTATRGPDGKTVYTQGLPKLPT